MAERACLRLPEVGYYLNFLILEQMKNFPEII